MFVAIAEMTLAEVAGGVSLSFHYFTETRRRGLQPSMSPSWLAVVMPERIRYCPVMNATRPAVQDGWP